MADQVKKNLKPSISSSFKPNYLKLGYHYFISNVIYLMLFFFIIPLLNFFQQLCHNLLIKLNQSTLFISFLTLLFFLTMVHFFINKNTSNIYLVDCTCCKPDPSYKTSKTTCIDRIAKHGTCTQKNIEFQRRLFERSGVGDETYVPRSVIDVPPRPTLEEGRNEAESLAFSAIDALLGKTGVLAKEIGIIVLNCTLFNPVPSLCSTIVNHYKLKEDVLSYNLGGMGCSAGLISIDLAKDLLKVNFCLLQFISFGLVFFVWYE